VHTFFQDLRFAARQLRKNPRFALIVVLAVALGIGANTAIFSCLNGFLRPLPVRSPEQIVVLAAQLKDDETGLRYRFSFAALNDLRRQADRFSDVFAFNAMLGGLRANNRVTPFLYSTVTGNFFPALGVKPVVGRLFLPGEGEGRGMETPVVLGYACWQRVFGGDPAVIGRQVRLDGFGARVIGVVPKEFLGTWAGAEMDGYLPVNVLSRYGDAASDFFTDRNRRLLTVMGRLKPGVSLREAQSSVDVIAGRLEGQYPATDKDIAIRVVPEQLARPVPVRFMAESLPIIRMFLLALAAMVLLLACMNVANLVMVRSSARQREMAIRAALGSGRGRLVRQMLTESCVLAFLGVAAGLPFGKWGSSAFAGSISAGTSLPVNVNYSFDWRVFGYALAAAVFTVLMIGLWPAIRASRIAGHDALRDGGWGGSAGRAGLRMRSTLVVAQVAASLMLLIVAGMLVRGLQHAQRLDLGFQPDHVLNVRLNPRDLGYSEQRTRDFYRELKRRTGALPGVQSVSLAFSVPLGYIFDGKDVYVEGRPVAPGDRAPHVMANSIDGDYFGTMRIPLLRGRAFTENDDEKAPLVAIVNQTMAARFWPQQDAIGKRFALQSGGPLWQVVGVVRDSKYLVIFENPLPYFYVPLAQNFYWIRVLQVHTALPPEALRTRVQHEIQALDPDLPLADFQTMTESLNGFMGFRMFQMGAQQAGAMGLLGLILAVIGVYGVVSYGAAQRTHEIGIRMALGAEPVKVLGMILRQGVWLVVAGVFSGLVAASLFTRLTSRVLPLVDRTDPMTFGVVTLLLAGITLWACYIPARRAMRVDPVVALRHE
jgi:macrolide transport system ATP-binding/permease protein